MLSKRKDLFRGKAYFYLFFDEDRQIGFPIIFNHNYCNFRTKFRGLCFSTDYSWVVFYCLNKNGEKISPQYPLSETVNGLLYVLVFWANDFDLWESGLTCLLASALLVLSVIDFRTFEIPLEINGFILVLGLLHTCLHRDCWYNYVLGFLLVSGILELIVLLSKGRAMGGGDVKLMAACFWAGREFFWRLPWGVWREP